jgi:uncharacterized protein (TIGR03437 family)
MRSILFVCLPFVPRLFADTVQTVPLLAYLTGKNANACALALVHEVFDDAGNLKSGSFEFNVAYNVAPPNSISGIQVGDNGGNVIVSAAAAAPAGGGATGAQVQFGTASGQPQLTEVQDLVANPENYSIELVTASGQVRGQLLPAQSTVLMGLLNNGSMVSQASAVTSVIALRALDSSGNVAAGLVTVLLNYSGFSNGSAILGFSAGNIGGLLASPIPTDPGGSGRTDFSIPITPADSSFAAESNSLNGLFLNPNDISVNLRTTNTPIAGFSCDLRSTDRAVFQVNLGAATDTIGNAPSALTVYTARNTDGSAAAAALLFDVNARLPGATTFTGLDLNAGPAGVNGPIAIESDVDLEPIPTTGNFSLFGPRAVSDSVELQAINGMLANPFAYYLSLRSLDIPGGFVRGQLSDSLAAPRIAGIAAASSTVRDGAPGSILSVYGSNLAAVTTDLSGFYRLTPLPDELNGVSVTIGGIPAAIFYVSAGLINVQAPYELSLGDHDLIVTTATGTGASRITIAGTAPSIFVADAANNLGAVVKNSDFSLVTPMNPVQGGDTLVIYSSGLGQTLPPVVTGSAVVPPGSGAFNNTLPVTVSIGGHDASVLYSIAAPGFVGLYQTAVAVPAGLSGNVSLTLSTGGKTSNSVDLAVR